MGDDEIAELFRRSMDDYVSCHIVGTPLSSPNSFQRMYEQAAEEAAMNDEEFPAEPTNEELQGIEDWGATQDPAGPDGPTDANGPDRIARGDFQGIAEEMFERLQRDPPDPEVMAAVNGSNEQRVRTDSWGRLESSPSRTVFPDQPTRPLQVQLLGMRSLSDPTLQTYQDISRFYEFCELQGLLAVCRPVHEVYEEYRERFESWLVRRNNDSPQASQYETAFSPQHSLRPVNHIRAEFQIGLESSPAATEYSDDVVPETLSVISRLETAKAMRGTEAERVYINLWLEFCRSQRLFDVVMPLEGLYERYGQQFQMWQSNNTQSVYNDQPPELTLPTREEIDADTSFWFITRADGLCCDLGTDGNIRWRDCLPDRLQFASRRDAHYAIAGLLPELHGQPVRRPYRVGRVTNLSWVLTGQLPSASMRYLPPGINVENFYLAGFNPQTNVWYPADSTRANRGRALRFASERLAMTLLNQRSRRTHTLVIHGVHYHLDAKIAGQDSMFMCSGKNVDFRVTVFTDDYDLRGSSAVPTVDGSDHNAFDRVVEIP